MVPFIYTVEELNRLGQVRAQLHTRNFYLALADWMLRAHKPLGFPPGVKASTGDLRIDAIGYHMPIEDIKLELEGVFSYQGQIVRSFKIRTDIATLDIPEGFTVPSANVYKTSEYWEAVNKMKARLERFCLEQPYAAYLLAQFAARDTQHPFWKPTIASRSRGLSF